MKNKYQSIGGLVENGQAEGHRSSSLNTNYPPLWPSQRLTIQTLYFLWVITEFEMGLYMTHPNQQATFQERTDFVPTVNVIAL